LPDSPYTKRIVALQFNRRPAPGGPRWAFARLYDYTVSTTAFASFA
jgi:hypothetical protein